MPLASSSSAMRAPAWGAPALNPALSHTRCIMDATIRNDLGTLWEIQSSLDATPQPASAASTGRRPMTEAATNPTPTSTHSGPRQPPVSLFRLRQPSRRPLQFLCSDFANPLAHTPTPTSTFLRDPQARTHFCPIIFCSPACLKEKKPLQPHAQRMAAP